MLEIILINTTQILKHATFLISNNSVTIKCSIFFSLSLVDSYVCLTSVLRAPYKQDTKTECIQCQG